MSASGIWNISEATFPANGSPREKLGFALKYAIRAPTERHWQPWEFRLADNHVELIASHNPLLEHIDLHEREAVIGCGVSLSHLKLALKQFGCLGRVELFPDLDEPALLARVHTGSGGLRDAQEKLLLEAMARQSANQTLSGDALIPDAGLEPFSCAIAGQRAWVEILQSESSLRRVMDLSISSQQQQVHHRNERPVYDFRGGLAWFGPTANELMRGRFARWTRPLLAFAVRRDDSVEVSVQPALESETRSAAMAVIKTKTDDKHGWLAAGEVLGRSILRAQALNLSWSFFNQAVRHREGREKLRTSLGHKGYAQAILRFGSVASVNYDRPTSPATVTATMQ